MPEALRDDPLRSALFTDLYELTMAQAYHTEGMRQDAVFELFFRELPSTRNYMVAAGLEDVLTFLENLRFEASDLAYLREQRLFSEDFLTALKNFRFTGEVAAMPEGTVVFPNEPLIQVKAPVLEAQLIETFLLNQIHFQTIAATKAARVVSAAQGRKVVDFGSRRAHGTDAALKVARTTYLTGGDGTSNMLAGKQFGIPVFGTMAHSYIQAHDDEITAFENFSRIFPHTTLLVDTYDTLAGVRKVIELSRRMGEAFTVRAIRLDSGNLAELASESRRLLDEAGLHEVRIFASSALDEYKIQDLLAAGAPIDGFGVGTSLAVSDDAPALDMAYKLVEYANKPRTKLSWKKNIYPNRKQVFRKTSDGTMLGDVIGRYDETGPGQPLLKLVMREGRRTADATPSLEEVRQYAQRERERLPQELLALEPADTAYPIEVTDALQRDLESVRQAYPPS